MAEAVVLHDRVSYTHPESDPAPGQPRAQAFADYGTTLTTEESDDPDAPAPITEKELKRLENMGAVTTETDSLSARLALAGEKPDARLSGPTYTHLRSPQEAVAAAKATAPQPGGAGPQSKAGDLARLSVSDLKVIGSAFGVPADVLEEGDKAAIVSHLTGDSDDALSTDDLQAQEQSRDEAQVQARGVGGESGQVGTNVTSQGTAPGAAAEEKKPTARRQSRAQSESA